MVKISPQNNSRNSVESVGLRGSWEIHIIVSIMGLQKERTDHNGSSERNATWPGSSYAPLGGSNKDSCVCTEPYSSSSTWQQNSARGFLRSETRSQPSKNIWLSGVHTCPKEKMTNLDPSRRKGVFLKYSDISKAYGIYFPGFKKIDISKYVTFDEDSAYFSSRRTSIQEVDCNVPFL